MEVRCPSCGQTYDVSVANILKSQRMLNEGCACRSESECAPLYLSALLNPGDLNNLHDAWEKLYQQAAAHGGRLLVLGSAHSE